MVIKFMKNNYPLKTLDATALNRNAAHTGWRAFENEAQALAFENSRYITSLNGEWLFKLYPDLYSTGEFYLPDDKREGFTNIPVPGCWELFGHGEPIYTNHHYPWSYEKNGRHLINPHSDGGCAPNPPFTPEDNPTGCYYRTFTLPEDYAEREIYLCFEGVETAYWLWVNGEFAGYAEDSKLPSEFNISRLLKPGENSVALKVAKWGKSSYLEDQDYWHISGIHRNVSLIAKPVLHIADYQIKAVLSEYGNTGQFSADISVSRAYGFADCSVHVKLYDSDGAYVWEACGKVNAMAEYTITHRPTANTARVKFDVNDVKSWSPETPYLYTAVISLLDTDGNVIDVEACKIGFKRVEIKNGILYLNGKRIVMQGVNRHHHQYDKGRAVTREFMIREIIEMKRMNINSVRTSHYPDSAEWYELCDEYGILVICECNIETHGVAGQLTHDPQWAPLFVERAARMALTFKNHACIYSWSLGNESGTGVNHAAMAGWLREYDDTRICQYEAGGPGKNISDIRGNMYAPVSQIMDMLTDPYDDRPVILVEYLYQIRNSGGGLYHFAEMTEKYARFQGGYTWDWSDKCLLQKDENGNDFFAYGGDFNESFTEDMCEGPCPLFMTNNGLVLPDLRWKPVAFELKQAYSPVAVYPEKINPWNVEPRTDRYIVKNKSFTRALSDYVITVHLREDGKTVHSYKLDVGDIAPLSENYITVDPDYPRNDNCEYTIEFSIALKDSAFYAESGYEVGFFQYPFAAALAGANCVRRLPDSEIEFIVNDDGNVNISKNGVIYAIGGTPCLDRPFTGMEWAWKFAPLRDGNTQISIDKIEKSADNVKVFYKIKSKVGDKTAESFVENRYALTAGGNLEVDVLFNLNPALNYIPRAGIELILPGGFEKLEYYGYGEIENYSDRSMSAKLGVFESTVTAQHFPFVPPSETGGHEQTRWVTLENSDGRKLTITGESPFHFDARHNSIGDYQNAKHDHELPMREETYLHIDAHHSGIGSNMGWSSDFSPEHLTTAGIYRLRFYISL